MENANVTDEDGINNVKKRISQHTVNLIIILIISILLLFNFGFPDLAANWQQWRVFFSQGTNIDILAKLLPLRVGIAFVFFWYAIDNFIYPEIFNNLANTVLKKMNLEKEKLVLYPFGYFQACIELLVGVSLVTGAFLDLGALIASLLLFSILFAYEEGLGALLVRDIGLLGATITLFLLSTTLHI